MGGNLVAVHWNRLFFLKKTVRPRIYFFLRRHIPFPTIGGKLLFHRALSHVQVPSAHQRYNPQRNMPGKRNQWIHQDSGAVLSRNYFPRNAVIQTQAVCQRWWFHHLHEKRGPTSLHAHATSKNQRQTTNVYIIDSLEASIASSMSSLKSRIRRAEMDGSNLGDIKKAFSAEATCGAEGRSGQRDSGELERQVFQMWNGHIYIYN